MPVPLAVSFCLNICVYAVLCVLTLMVSCDPWLWYYILVSLLTMGVVFFVRTPHRCLHLWLAFISGVGVVSVCTSGPDDACFSVGVDNILLNLLFAFLL